MKHGFKKMHPQPYHKILHQMGSECCTHTGHLWLGAAREGVVLHWYSGRSYSRPSHSSWNHPFTYQHSRFNLSNSQLVIRHSWLWISTGHHLLHSLIFSSISSPICSPLSSLHLWILWFVCSDLNCLGSNQSTVDPRLQETFDMFDLHQHVSEATGETIYWTWSRHTEPSLSVTSVLTMQVWCLVIAVLTLAYRACYACTTRAIGSINLVDLQSSLWHSSLFTNPSQTADGFAEQMRIVVHGGAG